MSRESLDGFNSLRLPIMRTPGWAKPNLLSTTVSRFGSGLPMDSNVFRPITITCPVVVSLNHLKSSGMCQGILFPIPITRFSDIAAMALKCFKLRCPNSRAERRQRDARGTLRKLQLRRRGLLVPIARRLAVDRGDVLD